MPPVPRERTTAPAVRQISSKYAPWFLPCNGHTQKEYRGVSLPAGVPRGKYNKPSAHGEGYIKRFLDTSSILVGSTKRVLDEHLLFQRRLRRQGFALIRTKNAILDKSLRWRFLLCYISSIFIRLVLPECPVVSPPVITIRSFFDNPSSFDAIFFAVFKIRAYRLHKRQAL